MAGLGQDRVASGALGARGILGTARSPVTARIGMALGARIVLEPPGQFITVDAGDVQVGEDRVGQQIERAFEGLEPVVRLVDAKADCLQPLREQNPAVAVVFDQQHERSLG